MEFTKNVHQALRASPRRADVALFSVEEHRKWLYLLEELVALQSPWNKWVRLQASTAAGGWRDLPAPEILKPGSIVRSLHQPSSHLKVAAVLLTRFRVNMTVFQHVASKTLVLVFTGLHSRDISAGATVTCHAMRRDFRTVAKEHGIKRPSVIPEGAQVHGGFAAAMHNFTGTKAWARFLELMPSASSVLISGFSFGGALTHLMGALALEHQAERGARVPVTLVAQGAPRSGNKIWASCFVNIPRVACVSLVHGSTVKPGVVQVDEVPTLPLTTMGFANCFPVVLVVDRARAKQTTALDNANVLGLEVGWHLCLGSINFAKGFTRQHRMVMHPPKPLSRKQAQRGQT